MSEPSPKKEMPTMTLVGHLQELRTRIIYASIGIIVGVVAGLIFSKQIIHWLEQPYFEVAKNLGITVKLIVMETTSGFVTFMKVGLYAGLIATSPWTFYQIWKFIGEGLFNKEKKLVMILSPISAILFLVGGGFFLLVVSKAVLTFFLQMNLWLGVTTMITFQNYISFMFNMMLIFGLAFQTPIVVVVLGLLGLVSPAGLKKYRRHVIVAMLVLAALTTSPSPVDQIALALPLWLLYEIGLLAVVILTRKKKK